MIYLGVLQVTSCQLLFQCLFCVWYLCIMGYMCKWCKLPFISPHMDKESCLNWIELNWIKLNSPILQNMLLVCFFMGGFFQPFFPSLRGQKHKLLSSCQPRYCFLHQLWYISTVGLCDSRPGGAAGAFCCLSMCTGVTECRVSPKQGASWCRVASQHCYPCCCKCSHTTGIRQQPHL